MAGDYLEWVEEDLLNVNEVLANLKAAKKEDRPEHLERIFHFSHDIKGQGGSFGYPIMTLIGGQLCAFVESLDGAGAAEIEVIELHIDAMKLVIAKRMSGDGGPSRTTTTQPLPQCLATRWTVASTTVTTLHHLSARPVLSTPRK